MLQSLFHRLTPNIVLIFSVATVLANILFGLFVFQDNNWDLKNYHHYSVYAWLNDRVGFDIAPGQRQTWTNPVGSLIPYLLVENLTPRLATLSLTILALPNIFLTLALTHTLLRQATNLAHETINWMSVLAAMAAAAAPFYFSVVGTTINDGMVAGFVVGALWLYLRAPNSLWHLLGVGILLGLAVGVKLTAAHYVVGFGAAVIISAPRQAFVRGLWSGTGFVLTVLLVSGPWFWMVYHLYENPIFPLFNNVFLSDWYALSPLRDERFLPKDGLLTFIWDIARGEAPSAEVSFRDARFLLVLIGLGCLLTFVVLSVARRAMWSRWVRSWPQVSPMLFVVVFYVATFLVWSQLFGIQRYTIALEHLGLLVLFVIILMIWRVANWPIKHCVFAMVAGFVLTILGTFPATWGRQPHGPDWFGVQLPPALEATDTLYVMLTSDPYSYVVTRFEPSNRFVRIEGNLPLPDGVRLTEMVQRVIAEHAGPIRTLGLSAIAVEASAENLTRFGLQLDDLSQCVDFATAMDRLRSCPLSKRP